MKEFVLKLIEKKKKRYIDDYGEMLGDYQRELETIKGYNGRQLLELLQNCDDEGATKVTITLDKDAKTISISKIDTTSNIVNILPFGGETIVGDSSVELLEEGEVLNFITNGTNWYLGA